MGTLLQEGIATPRTSSFANNAEDFARGLAARNHDYDREAESPTPSVHPSSEQMEEGRQNLRSQWERQLASLSLDDIAYFQRLMVEEWSRIKEPLTASLCQIFADQPIGWYAQEVHDILAMAVKRTFEIRPTDTITPKHPAQSRQRRIPAIQQREKVKPSPSHKRSHATPIRRQKELKGSIASRTRSKDNRKLKGRNSGRIIH